MQQEDLPTLPDAFERAKAAAEVKTAAEAKDAAAPHLYAWQAILFLTGLLWRGIKQQAVASNDRCRHQAPPPWHLRP
jgi:hypothetical protein